MMKRKANDIGTTWREVEGIVSDVHDQLRNLRGLCKVLKTFQWTDPEPLNMEDIGYTAQLMEDYLSMAISGIESIEDFATCLAGEEVRSKKRHLSAVQGRAAVPVED